MARIIDESKIEKIKEAAMELVVEQGYGGASVSKIARKAKVAEGYLYRHYKSKNDLIYDMLNTSINEIIIELEAVIEHNSNVKEIIEKAIRIIFASSTQDMMRMKFLYVLMNDYNFSIGEELQKRTIKVCEKVIAVGAKKNQLQDGVNEEDIYLMCISYTIQFINHRWKNYFGITTLDEEAIQKVLRSAIGSICLPN